MKYMKTLFCCLILAMVARAQFGKSPFEVELSLLGDRSTESAELSVKLMIPADHIIYSDTFAVTAGEGVEIATLSKPEHHEKPDLIDPAIKVNVFDSSFDARYKLSALKDGATLTLAFQGCNKSICFMPETHVYRFDQEAFAFVDADAVAVSAAVDTAAISGTQDKWLQGGTLATAGGYLSAADFLAFLDKADGKPAVEQSGFKQFLDDPVSFLKTKGVVLTLLLVLLGGILLNLTPCVLPMIPINLAIIGADAGTKGRGFVRGSAYGLGIVMVYGGLGWLILRLGLFFGAIQSNPWFNLVIGIVFIGLALALFDVFIIDLSRFMSSKSGNDNKKGLFAAFAIGAVSALLAGACVAPVVIAVLLLAGNLYAGGMQAAQFLPFLLGVGMALPWPLAGAGLSVLPSPGMWMVRVKQFFGVFIILMAIYYFYLAGSGFFGSKVARSGSILAGDHAAWMQKVEEARSTGKPLFVDFWATWCKNCTVMEKKTFKDETVEKRLRNYVVVKVQAEQPDRSPAKEMLEAFETRGLPGFAVLKLK
jgi:thiol:disulfide interchange protein